jgi:hypothetical protein
MEEEIKEGEKDGLRGGRGGRTTRLRRRRMYQCKGEKNWSGGIAIVVIVAIGQ